jgi:hypothetical protein
MHGGMEGNVVCTQVQKVARSNPGSCNCVSQDNSQPPSSTLTWLDARPCLTLCRRHNLPILNILYCPAVRSINVRIVCANALSSHNIRDEEVSLLWEHWTMDHRSRRLHPALGNAATMRRQRFTHCCRRDKLGTTHALLDDLGT